MKLFKRRFFLEWSDIGWIVFAIFREEVAALAVYAAGVSFKRALVILLIGSSIGVFVFYHLREIMVFLYRHTRIKKLVDWFFSFNLSRTPMPTINNGTDLTDYLKSTLKVKHRDLVDRISQHHVLPGLTVFVTACIPWPFLMFVAILCSWIIGLRHGFLIILTGSIIRTIIYTVFVYGSLQGLRSLF